MSDEFSARKPFPFPHKSSAILHSEVRYLLKSLMLATYLSWDIFKGSKRNNSSPLENVIWIVWRNYTWKKLQINDLNQSLVFQCQNQLLPSRHDLNKTEQKTTSVDRQLFNLLTKYFANFKQPRRHKDDNFFAVHAIQDTSGDYVCQSKQESKSVKSISYWTHWLDCICYRFPQFFYSSSGYYCPKDYRLFGNQLVMRQSERKLCKTT